MTGRTLLVVLFLVLSPHAQAAEPYVGSLRG